MVDIFHSRNLFPVQREVIANGLTGPLIKGNDLKPDTATLLYFHANEANRATRDRAVWLLDALGDIANLQLDSAQKRACMEAFHDRMFEVAPAKTETRKKNK